MEMEITSVRRSRLMHQLFSEEGLAERRRPWMGSRYSKGVRERERDRKIK